MFLGSIHRFDRDRARAKVIVTSLREIPTNRLEKIPLLYLPKNRVPVNHARTILGTDATDHQVEMMEKTIVTDRRQLVEFAKVNLRKQMLVCAVGMKMKVRDKTSPDGWCPVQTFDQIGESWKDDGSLENCEKLFNVMYQQYDNYPHLVTDIEEAFMRGRFEYTTPPTGRKKGCVFDIIASQRQSLKRLINGRSATTHGRTISISRKGAPPEARYLKRKRGVFSLEFVKCRPGDDVLHNVKREPLDDVKCECEPFDDATDECCDEDAPTFRNEKIGNSNKMIVPRSPVVLSMKSAPTIITNSSSPNDTASMPLADAAIEHCSASSVSTMSLKTPVSGSNRSLVQENKELRSQMMKLAQKAKDDQSVLEEKKRKEIIEIGMRTAQADARKKKKAANNTKKPPAKKKKPAKNKKQDQKDASGGKEQTNKPLILQIREYKIAKNRLRLHQLGLLKDSNTVLDPLPKTPPQLTTVGAVMVNTSTRGDGSGGSDDSASDVSTTCAEEAFAQWDEDYMRERWEDNGDGSSSDRSANTEETEENRKLVEEGESIVSVRGRKVIDGKVFLTIEWDTGGVEDAPYQSVVKDSPDLVRDYYKFWKDQHERAKKWKVGYKPPVSTPEKKKPHVEDQLQSPGQCNCDHSKPSTFVSEDDARYWDKGNMYEGKICDRCGNDSRPPSKKQPSYKCVDALTAGCLEVRCHSCYVEMVIDE